MKKEYEIQDGRFKEEKAKQSKSEKPETVKTRRKWSDEKEELTVWV